MRHPAFFAMMTSMIASIVGPKAHDAHGMRVIEIAPGAPDEAEYAPPWLKRPRATPTHRLGWGRHGNGPRYRGQWRGDGRDEERIAAAAAKQDRKAKRRLELARRS